MSKARIATKLRRLGDVHNSLYLNVGQIGHYFNFTQESDVVTIVNLTIFDKAKV
jgi:hypothetical protein